MDLSTDARYELLADARRRAIIIALATETTPVALGDLASEVAVREADDESVPDRVRLSLYHTHLPKLADTGVVSFDADSNTATEGPNFDAMRRVVTGLDDREGDESSRDVAPEITSDATES